MQSIRDTLGGLWELVLLAILARFRLRSGYLRWRDETAFGTDPANRPSLSRRLGAMIAYGRWVYRLKRFR